MILLIGTGYMAREYAKVLSHLSLNYEVIGRSREKCIEFGNLFPGVQVREGGLESCELGKEYTHAIIASGVECLYSNAAFLLKNNVKRILVEKPAAKTLAEVEALNKLAKEKGADILVAYNRRFYSSVMRAGEMIREDGGALSCHFEFTEWPHTIEGLEIDHTVKQNWFLANSSHVVDTAFLLCGRPVEMHSFVSGSLDWHPSAAVFAGAGRTDRSVLFSYAANWKSSGRWSVEVMTASRRYILRPMEKLQVQELRTVAVTPVEIDDQLDTDFKPGLLLQTRAFVEGDFSRLCTLDEQEVMIREVYNKISNY